jgi:hypothetical protein
LTSCPWRSSEGGGWYESCGAREQRHARGHCGTPEGTASQEGTVSQEGALTPTGAVKKALLGTALALLALTLIGGYGFNWSWTGFPGNTLWDWMNLLLLPVTLGLLSLAFELSTGVLLRAAGAAALILAVLMIGGYGRGWSWTGSRATLSGTGCTSSWSRSRCRLWLMSWSSARKGERWPTPNIRVPGWMAPIEGPNGASPRCGQRYARKKPKSL